jgi:hypothetical protein
MRRRLWLVGCLLMAGCGRIVEPEPPCTVDAAVRWDSIPAIVETAVSTDTVRVAIGYCF